jgi:hypothetical protein
MSTTPRTDAAKEQYLTGKMGIYGVLDEARTLENELASMSIISGRWEADALRYVKNAEYWQARAEKAEAELVHARVMVRVLREALELITNQADACRAFCDTFTPSSRIKSRVALAETKETSK